MRIDLFWAGLFGFLFRDPARPVELLSGTVMAGWAWQLLSTPQMLERDGYRAFDALPAAGWCFLMTMIALAQTAAMLRSVPSRGAIRFAAMACSAGIWTIVAINFIGAGVPTTGALTYLSLALVTALCGVWCAWNRS